MARAHRIHFDASDEGAILARGICGAIGAATTTTLDRQKVSCVLCERRLRARAEEDRRSSYVSHSGFLEATIEPLTRTGSKRKLHALVYGFACFADAIAENTSSTRHPVRRATAFASVRHALAELVRVRLDGYETVSLSSPERIEALTGALGSGSSARAPDDRAARQADNVVHVDQAFMAAYPHAWDGIEALTAEWCRWVLLVRHVAKKSGAETAEIVAELLAEEERARVTPHLVSRVARYGYEEVSKALVSRQLIEHHDEGTGDRHGRGGVSSGEDDMRGWLVGWGAIATHLGVAERTAQRWADEGMPTTLMRGKVQAKPDELDAWVEAQRVPRASSAPPAKRETGT